MAKVLVVDDDPDSAELLSKMLAQAGHRSSSAPNGKEALSSLLNDLPDVVLLDVFMPEMSGVELLEIIRSYLRLQNLPVVVVTAYPESAAVQRAKRLKVRHVLAKSKFTPEEMLKAVEEAASSAAP